MDWQPAYLSRTSTRSAGTHHTCPLGNCPRWAFDTAARRQRSAVTNGTRLFVEGDGNSAWSRRYADLIRAHIVDMGGEDRLSESEKSLIRRASAIECELEQMEGRLSQGEQVDLDAFTRAVGHLRRVFETLGLRRQPRDVSPPSVEAYLRHKQTVTTGAEGDSDEDHRPVT